MPGAQGPKTVKGAQSDPIYISRLLLDCVPVFHKIITLPTYFTVRSECLPGGAKIIVTPLAKQKIEKCTVRRYTDLRFLHKTKPTGCQGTEI